MKLLFLIKEGMIGFQRARLAAWITVLTVSLALAMVGVFLLLAHNLSAQFERQFRQIHLRVYLNPGMEDEGIQRFRQDVAAMPEVQSVRFISADQALQEFARDFGPELLDVLDDNPLPPSLDVVLRTEYASVAEVRAVVARLEERSEVDDVDFQEHLVRLLNDYFTVGLFTAAGLGLVIFLISAVLIFNTIRLTIHARREVIDIMQLVGATNAFIKAPFLIEGILQGLIGSLLATGLLWAITVAVQRWVFPGLEAPPVYFVYLIGTGIILGLMGSYVSVGRHLRI